MIYPTQSWLGLVLLSVLSFSVFGGPKLRLVANEWPPYTANEPPGNGSYVSQVRSLLAKAGYDSSIEIMPWARALQLVYSGKADGIVAIWSTTERRQQIVFSNAYAANTLRLYSIKGRLGKIANLSELNGQVIGVGRNYGYSDVFLAMKNFRTEESGNTLLDIQKLIKNRIDAVLEDERIFRYYVGKNPELVGGMEEFEISPPVMVLPLYFGVSRKRADAQKIIQDFNRVLSREKATQR
jgi:polar amino acid transport system substrate-binding protein